MTRHLVKATAASISIISAYGCMGDVATDDGQSVATSESAVMSAAPFGCGGTHVALRASTGHYVVAEGGGGGAMNANRAAIGPWETFTVHDLGGGKIALQTIDGHFVVAEGGGGHELKADRPWIGSWETFGLERHWNGVAWALRASDGSYVVAESGGGREMNANRPGVGPWEAFTAVCLD